MSQASFTQELSRQLNESISAQPVETAIPFPNVAARALSFLVSRYSLLARILRQFTFDVKSIEIDGTGSLTAIFSFSEGVSMRKMEAGESIANWNHGDFFCSLTVLSVQRGKKPTFTLELKVGR